MQSLVGQSIGRFEIVEEIGRGGMGIVYRAVQPSLGRQVAIKVLPPYLAVQEGHFVERFLREARAAARLNHPNIVTIHDVGSYEGFYYIVMEEVKGQPLNVLLAQSGPLSLKRATAIITQVAAALDYAHAQGIIHRDVKPANILVATDGTAKLVDFGIARVAQEPGLTATGFSFGTAAYVAPEQIEGAEATAASDIYALGIVFYEMLTGHPPFQGATPTSILYKHVHEAPPPLRASMPAPPGKLEQVVRKSLAKDPVERYATASAFVAALAPLADRGKDDPRAARPSPPPQVAPTHLLTPQAVQAPNLRPARKRRAVWLGSGALLLLLLAGAAALLLALGRNGAPLASLAVAQATFAPATATAVAPLPTAAPSVTLLPATSLAAKAATARSSTAPAAATATSSPRPSATPSLTPTPDPSPTPPSLDLVRPAPEARVAAAVTFECKPVTGAVGYRFETREVRSVAGPWRKSPRLVKCLWSVTLAQDSSFVPGKYEWRAVALDASDQVLSTSLMRSLQIVPRTVTPTRARATSTPEPARAATAVPSQPPSAPPPPAPDTPAPPEPPTRTPEPLPEPPTRTPEPLPTS